MEGDDMQTFMRESGIEKFVSRKQKNASVAQKVGTGATSGRKSTSTGGIISSKTNTTVTSKQKNKSSPMEEDDRDMETERDTDDEETSLRQNANKSAKKKINSSAEKRKKKKLKKNLDSSSDEEEDDDDDEDTPEDGEGSGVVNSNVSGGGQDMGQILDEWRPVEFKQLKYKRKFLNFPGEGNGNEDESRKRRKHSQSDSDSESDPDYAHDGLPHEDDSSCDLEDPSRCQFCKLKFPRKLRLPIFVFDPSENVTIVSKRQVHVYYPEIPQENMKQFTDMVKLSQSSGSMQESCGQLTDYFNSHIVQSVNKKFLLGKPKLKVTLDYIKDRIEFVSSNGQTHSNGMSSGDQLEVGSSLLSNILSTTTKIKSNSIETPSSGVSLQSDDSSSMLSMNTIKQLLNTALYGKKKSSKFIGYEAPEVGTGDRFRDRGMINENRKQDEIKKKKKWKELCRELDNVTNGTVMEGRLFVNKDDEINFYMMQYGCSIPKETDFNYMVAMQPLVQVESYQTSLHYEAHDRSTLSQLRKHAEETAILASEMYNSGSMVEQNIVTGKKKFDYNMIKEYRGLLSTQINVLSQISEIRNTGKSMK